MIAEGGRGLVFSSFPVSKKGLLSFERRFFFFFRVFDEENFDRGLFIERF